MNWFVKYSVTLLIGALVGIILCLSVTMCTHKGEEEKIPTEIHDTIIRTDVEVRETVRYITKHDTSIVVLNKHTHDTDTVYINLPIEHKEYKDTIGRDSAKATINIRYSGYRAKIDTAVFTLDVLPPSPVKVKKGWGQFVGVGVGAGYGFGVIDRRVYLGPEIGIHLVYGFGYHW